MEYPKNPLRFLSSCLALPFKGMFQVLPTALIHSRDMKQLRLLGANDTSRGASADSHEEAAAANQLDAKGYVIDNGVTLCARSFGYSSFKNRVEERK